MSGIHETLFSGFLKIHPHLLDRLQKSILFGDNRNYLINNEINAVAICYANSFKICVIFILTLSH